MTLAACPSCSRHVRVNETRCPFCAHALDGVFDDRPAARSVVGRFSRAALFALGASAAAAGTTLACSSSDDTEGAVNMPVYGAPARVEDAGTDAGNDDSGATQAIYGAPANPPDAGTK